MYDWDILAVHIEIDVKGMALVARQQVALPARVVVVVQQRQLLLFDTDNCCCCCCLCARRALTLRNHATVKFSLANYFA